jgi:hypothetical protein
MGSPFSLLEYKTAQFAIVKPLIEQAVVVPRINSSA